jgi:hypothetical protein
MLLTFSVYIAYFLGRVRCIKKKTGKNGGRVTRIKEERG